MQKRKINKKKIVRLLLISLFIICIAYFVSRALNGNKDQAGKNTPDPAMTVQPAETSSPKPTSTPEQNPVTSGTPAGTEDPDNPGSPAEGPAETGKPQELFIRTDYEAFLPNEAGDIPVVMFHNFIEAYAENTEKEFTTTFAEFEQLLETLYNEGYRLISMQDFIDCNISVPAGLKPMVFTFDDGTPGQFNLIKENGTLKVNPKSAAGIMIEFNKKHPDFGLKGIFYVNMNIGDNTFAGEGTLEERFEMLLDLGFELGNHTWGHVDYTESKNNSAERIQESLGKNQEKAEEILPGLRFYSLALPYGSLPVNKSLRPLLKDGLYNGKEYHHETIMAVGAEPSVPSVSVKYNSDYVRRIRAQGREPVPCDLTWWLPKMTSSRMFISDGDPETIVVPEEKSSEINTEKLGNKVLITY